MDMLVDDLTNGGIDRLPEQFAVPHIRALVANSSPGRREVGFEHRIVGDLGGPQSSLDRFVVVAGLVVVC